MNLEEATIKALQETTVKDMYNQLDNTKDINNVEGLVDDILVVTDPEVTSEEYDEVIERAQEIIEDTPEGEIPFDADYVGQYLLTCPICGTTFTSETMLEPGATCPACMEVPEAFVVKGQVQTDEDVAIDNGLQVDEDQATEEEVQPQSDITTDEDTDIEDNEEEPERQVASKEVPQGNKLQESVSNENKTFSFYKFVSGYPELAEFKSKANEYKDLYDLDSFKFRRSDGTYKDDETEEKLNNLDKELTKEIYDTLVNNNTYIVLFDDAKQQLIIGKTNEEVKQIIDNYKKSPRSKSFEGYDVNSYELFKDWFNRMDYPEIGRNPYRITDNIKTENKTIKTEDSYDEGIFYEIEEALREAGLNPVRFTDDGVMTNNLGWTVTGENGIEQQITCDGSYLTESKSDEVTAGNIKQKAQELLPVEDIETHDGDLYLKVSDKSTELVNKLKDKGNGLLKTFKSEKDGSMWYDIPFANMEDDYKLKNNLNECEIDDDFNGYYESKDVKTEDNNNDRLPVEGDGIEVIVTENSVGYLLRGLIIDRNNKQFQYVQGQTLPLGKYKRVSKNTMRNTIKQLQDEEYTEYKGKDSIALEENVQYAKFERYQIKRFIENNKSTYGIYDLVEKKYVETNNSYDIIKESYNKLDK